MTIVTKLYPHIIGSVRFLQMMVSTLTTICPLSLISVLAISFWPLNFSYRPSTNLKSFFFECQMSYSTIFYLQKAPESTCACSDPIELSWCCWALTRLRLKPILTMSSNLIVCLRPESSSIRASKDKIIPGFPSHHKAPLHPQPEIFFVCFSSINVWQTCWFYWNLFRNIRGIIVTL